MARRRITSYDVAREAGVSQTTVSFVLNRVAEASISDETRQRVVAAAERLGYVPDAAAQALVRGRTQIIGVVVTTLKDPFIGALVNTIESAARDEGYVVILASSDDVPEREVAAARMLQSRRVDGVIIASSRAGALYKGQLERMRVPLVVINSLVDPSERLVYSVGVDNRHGGQAATAHLIDRGHRRIAYVASPPDRNDNKERLAGYRQALADAGIAYSPSLVVRGTGDTDGGQQALPVLLSMEEPPSAVFCYNDLTAIGLIDAARRAGLAVPGEMAVVGFDDIPFAQLCDPPLTTIEQPIAEMGRKAIDRVLALLSDDGEGAAPDRNAAIHGKLVVRASSGEAGSRGT
jgi:DNA-binding LacI/PurR family transcriptional regulator